MSCPDVCSLMHTMPMALLAAANAMSTWSTSFSCGFSVHPTQYGRLQMQIEEAVRTFLAGYFSTCERSKKTQSAYRIDLDQLRAYVGSATLLADLGPDVLEAWAADFQKDGY